jgi:hypothetical protein
VVRRAVVKPERKYTQVKEGVWTSELWSRNLDQCCDCGLVHEVSYRIVKGVLQSRSTYARGETAKIRKQDGIEIHRLR